MSKNNDFHLPGFPGDDLPESIIVTEETKRAFYAANSIVGKRGQGMVGGVWLGKNEKGEDVAFCDGVIAFNKDDGKKRENKYGEPYKEGEYAYTDERLGGNSGQNHMQWVEILKGRIKQAIKENNKNELNKYAYIYKEKSNGEIEIDKSKILGAGWFKGDDHYLLNQVRRQSANLNFHSVNYNQEYRYIYCFADDEDINLSRPQEYFLRRPIPLKLAIKIENALVAQLPLDHDKIARKCFESVQDDNCKDGKILPKWYLIKNDPHSKILALLESLCKFISLNFKIIENRKKETDRFVKDAVLERIEEIVQFIKKNVDEIADETEKEKILKKYLNTPTKHNGLTVLMTARHNDHNEIANFLVKNGAELFDEKTSREEKTAVLFDAISKENYDLVKDILDSKCDLQKVDKEGMTPIMRAAHQKNMALVKILVEYAISKENYALIKDILDSKYELQKVDKEGMTPLMRATQQNNMALAKILIECGADVTQTVDSLRAASFAIRNLSDLYEPEDVLDVELPVFLIKKEAEAFKQPALIYALKEYGYLCTCNLKAFICIVNELIKFSGVNARDSDNRTALIHAMSSHNEELTAFLLENKADINAIDNSHKTVLHYAISTGKKSIIKELIKHGAKIYQSGSEPNLLMAAILEKNTDMALFLLEEESKKSGRAPILTAIECQECFRELDKEKLFNSLIGADLNRRYQGGKTALIIAVESNNPIVMDMLIQRGADINLADDSGKTAQMYARERNRPRLEMQDSLKILEKIYARTISHIRFLEKNPRAKERILPLKKEVQKVKVLIDQIEDFLKKSDSQQPFTEKLKLDLHFLEEFLLKGSKDEILPKIMQMRLPQSRSTMDFTKSQLAKMYVILKKLDVDKSPLVALSMFSGDKGSKQPSSISVTQRSSVI